MSRTPISEQFSALCRSISSRRRNKSSSSLLSGGAASTIKWHKIPSYDCYDYDCDSFIHHHQNHLKTSSSRKNSKSSLKYKDVIRELSVYIVRGPAAASQVRVIASNILEHLDYSSLRSAELVSTYWRSAVVNGKLYKKLYERNIRTNADWKEMMHNKSDNKQWNFDCTTLNGSSRRTMMAAPLEEHRMYKQFCRDVVVAIESLEANWRGFKVDRQTLDDKETFTLSGVQHFQMDSQRIVTHVICQNFSYFNVFNRWTLELERRIMPHIRNVPMQRCKRGGQRRRGGGGSSAGDCCFYFSNDLLAVFCPNSNGAGAMVQDSQQIWQVSTGAKLYAFDDFGVLESMAFVHHHHGCWERKKSAVGGRFSPSGKYYAFWRMSHYALKQQQFSSVATPPAPLMECRFMLTLRTIGGAVATASSAGGSSEQVQQQQQYSIVGSIRKVEQYSSSAGSSSCWPKLFLDDTFTIVYAFFGGSQLHQQPTTVVDIRSTSTLDILHTINVGHLLDYSNGYIIARPWQQQTMEMRDSPTSDCHLVKMWDVKTATCIANILDAPSSTVRPRLIGDKYLVRFSSSNYRLRIYDLQALVSKQQTVGHHWHCGGETNNGCIIDSDDNPNAHTSNNKLPHCYTGDGSEFLISKFQLPPYRLYDHMVADKYQIYLVAGVHFQSNLSCVDLLDFTAAAANKNKRDAAICSSNHHSLADVVTELPELKKLFLSKKEMENSFGNLYDL